VRSSAAALAMTAGHFVSIIVNKGVAHKRYGAGLSLPAINRILLALANRLGQIGVAQRQRRSRFQFPDEQRQPHAEKPDDRYRIEPINHQALAAELRRDQPEKVYHPPH